MSNHASGQAPSGVAPKVGYVRFWNMASVKGSPLVLRKANSPAEADNLILANPYRYAGYSPLPVAKYQLGIFKQNEPRPLKIIDLDLKPNAFFSIVVSPFSTEVLDDTIDSSATTGIVTIRNFFPGVTVAALSGADTLVAALPYGQRHVSTGLPLSRIPVTFRARLPDGSLTESTQEVDLVTSKRATVLIIPDSYGLFRVRIIADGKKD